MNSTMGNISTGLSGLSSSSLSVQLTLSYNLFLNGNKKLCGQQKTNSKHTTVHVNIQNIFTSTNFRTQNTRWTKPLLVFPIKSCVLNSRVHLVRINDLYL